MKIYINDKKTFSVYDGEPEDSNLSRDFNDCWFIANMMEQAYLAGKAGEDFDIINEESDEI